ncbi:hypothetical protein [Celeribacter indicus]|uniref:Antibiotic biosynthesis monooxygenase n=1 Tax=Celeribacter indicus TaxID=1208324 RepID=A0A0B5E2W0_9RHOB|nr:hypothetical protein [Celeribacter indicus]AJE47685.1 hypothetical protein P73_2970 [Celeribacter indicus]SDW14244.1 hypothetical protein SAMN05443573_101531 [Celeribacter indicus]
MTNCSNDLARPAPPPAAAAPRGFTLSASATAERAAGLAADMSEALAALRRNPLVDSIEFREKRSETGHRFQITVHARAHPETDENPLGELIRELQDAPDVDVVTETSCLSALKNKLPHTPLPPFWKRWLVSMIAVYPALIVIFYMLRPVAANLPTPLSLFLVAFFLTGLNARYILPFLNRRLPRWLFT